MFRTSHRKHIELTMEAINSPGSLKFENALPLVKIPVSADLGEKLVVELMLSTFLVVPDQHQSFLTVRGKSPL